jgi:hypothetical protein
MVLPNWCTVFLLGCWYGEREAAVPSSRRDAIALGAAFVLVVTLMNWSTIVTPLPFARDFPFMQLTLDNPMIGLLLMSAMVSALYIGATWLAFRAVEPFPAPWPVRFLARNTLVIFLAHMPLVFGLTPIINGLGATRVVRSLILLVVCLPGLALLSEVLKRMVQLDKLRETVYGRLQAKAQPLAPPRALS